MKPHLKFHPTVVSEFHLNQSITLIVFVLKLHSMLGKEKLCALEVSRAFLRSVEIIEPFSLCPSHFFVAVFGISKGQIILLQRVFHCVIHLISTCYQLAEPLPPSVQAHSRRAQASTSACFRNVPVSEICKAVTWSNPLTFVKLYALDMGARMDAKFGRAVVQSDIVAALHSYCPRRILLAGHLQWDPLWYIFEERSLFTGKLVLWDVVMSVDRTSHSISAFQSSHQQSYKGTETGWFSHILLIK